ncbi:hypothetical protein F5Y19DRAFT_230900 [Xylariaceae sp. FL1651]|nr:hypothetical protein F5Y19DRAFT_230900 [Xylariaceae sp. FL1651]
MSGAHISTNPNDAVPTYMYGLPRRTEAVKDTSSVHSHIPYSQPSTLVRTVSSAIGSDQDAEVSKRPPKRSRYSYHKCSYCRKDKQKCEPAGRQWPGQKCRRCVQKGFGCSEAQTTKSENTSQPKDTLSPIQQATTNKQALTAIDPLLGNCLLALIWYRMLVPIESAAKRIDSALQKRARIWSNSTGQSRVPKGFSNGIAIVKFLFCKQKNALFKQKSAHEREEISRILQTAMQALSTGGSSSSIEVFRTMLAKHDLNQRHVHHEITSFGSYINTIYAPECPTVSTISGYTHDMPSLAEGYIKSVMSFWERISTVYGGAIPQDSPPSLHDWWKPFLHDFWCLRAKGSPAEFIQYLSKAKSSSRLGRDSLGRTTLHFIVERLPAWLDLFPISEIDAMDNFGRTALHIACAADNESGVQGRQYNQCIIIQTLLKKNANVDIQDSYGLRAIDYAIVDNRADILQIFKTERHLEIDNILSSMADAREAMENVRNAAKQACQRLTGEKIAEEQI